MIPTPQHCLVLRAYHHPKKQNVSQGHGWLQPVGASDRPRYMNLLVLGGWVPIRNSSGCHYSYGHSLCVCSLCVPDSIYPQKSLLIRIGDPCTGLGDPSPRVEGAPTLQFLSGPSAAEGPCTGYFPFYFGSLLTGWYGAPSVLLDFKTSRQLTFLWLFWLTVGRLAKIPSRGQEQVDWASTYSAMIFSQFF